MRPKKPRWSCLRPPHLTHHPPTHPRPPLKVFAGKYMVPQEAVRVLGRPAFHDTALTCRQALAAYGRMGL